MVRFPHACLHQFKQLMQGFRSSISHFEQGMEKTQDDRDVREQNLPGALRGWPAVRIDRVGGVIRLHGARFAGKDALP